MFLLLAIYLNLVLEAIKRHLHKNLSSLIR